MIKAFRQTQKLLKDIQHLARIKHMMHLYGTASNNYSPQVRTFQCPKNQISNYSFKDTKPKCSINYRNIKFLASSNKFLISNQKSENQQLSKTSNKQKDTPTVTNLKQERLHQKKAGQINNLQKNKKKNIIQQPQENSYRKYRYSLLVALLLIYLLRQPAQQFYKKYRQFYNVWTYSINQQMVQPQPEEFNNQELINTFQKILSNEEKIKLPPHINIIDGIPGTGKTTTLKRLIRQLRKDQNRLYKVFYFTFAPEDSIKIYPQPFYQFNKTLEQQKLVQLFALLYSIQIQYRSFWNKLFDYQKFQTIKDNQKQKTIIPIIIIDDIHRLQNLAKGSTGFNQVLGYMQSLLSALKVPIRIFCISSSTSFYNNLKNDTSINKGKPFKYTLLQPLSKQTNQNIIRAIAKKHISKNKKLFQNVLPSQTVKICTYFQDATQLPRTVDYIFGEAFQQMSQKQVSQQNIVNQLHNKLKAIHQQYLIDQFKKMKRFFKSPSICKVNTQTAVKMLQFIGELPTNQINQQSCSSLLQALKNKVIQKDVKLMEGTLNKLQQLGFLYHCHPKSESQKSVIFKVKEYLQTLVK